MFKKLWWCSKVDSSCNKVKCHYMYAILSSPFGEECTSDSKLHPKCSEYAPSDSLHVSECCGLLFPKCPSVCCSCDDSDHDVHYFSTGVLVCVHPKGVLHAFTSS